jgi:hypothetical protein
MKTKIKVEMMSDVEFNIWMGPKKVYPSPIDTDKLKHILGVQFNNFILRGDREFFIKSELL